MNVDVAKLLVLKAFYLGRAVSEKRQSLAAALSMIDTAVHALSERQDQQSRMRLAFYLLLKAEILRESSDVLELRARVQAIAPSIYEHFMAVEDATQSRKKAYGMHQAVIADEGVKRGSGSYLRWDGDHIDRVAYDAALRALGVDELSLGDKEMTFLHKVTLLEMLKHHGISYAP